MNVRRPMLPTLPTLLTLLTAAVCGCSFSKFNDFEDRAPAVKIEQQNRKSAVFGVGIAALPRRKVGELQPGAALVASGNTPVALNTVLFGADGAVASNSEADGEDFIKRLDDPSQITALAPAPSDEPPMNFSGPFVYVGLSREQVGAVRVVDINTYDGPGELTAPDSAINNFGLALVPADLGGGDRADDLVIGARGAVVLWRSSGWPSFSRPRDALVVDTSPRWPTSGKFDALASGQLAASGRYEVAAGARDKNFVAVIHHVTGHGGDTCDNACVDVTSDAGHCGGCDNECGPGEACVGGRCRLPDDCDSATQAMCDGRCVNLLADNRHCGACDRACDTSNGLYCKAGACACGAGRTECGGACVDTDASASHCGGCDQPCSDGQVCEGGQCKVGDCSAGLTACPEGGRTSCVDLQTSADHCGACHSRCTGNLTCQKGQCACVPFEVLELPLPDNAIDFGASLLIADVDKDGAAELIVGAPGSDGGGAVYVYDLDERHFSGLEPPPDPTVIRGTDGAMSFGAALAVGKFDSRDRLLAVGAPSSDVGGTPKAGRIYLFDAQLKDPVGVVELVRPVEKGHLGSALTTLPFKGTDNTHDVLVASSSRAVYVFFANTTPEHEDIRPR